MGFFGPLFYHLKMCHPRHHCFPLAVLHTCPSVTTLCRWKQKLNKKKVKRKEQRLNLHGKIHLLHLMKKPHNKSLTESLCVSEGSDVPGYDAHSPSNPSSWVVIETWGGKIQSWCADNGGMATATAAAGPEVKTSVFEGLSSHGTLATCDDNQEISHLKNRWNCSGKKTEANCK